MKLIIKTILILPILFILSLDDAPAEVPTQSWTDYQCVNDCTMKGYQYQLCVKMCSY